MRPSAPRHNGVMTPDSAAVVWFCGWLSRYSACALSPPMDCPAAASGNRSINRADRRRMIRKATLEDRRRGKYIAFYILLTPKNRYERTKVMSRYELRPPDLSRVPATPTLAAWPTNTI